MVYTQAISAIKQECRNPARFRTSLGGDGGIKFEPRWWNSLTTGKNTGNFDPLLGKQTLPDRCICRLKPHLKLRELPKHADSVKHGDQSGQPRRRELLYRSRTTQVPASSRNSQKRAWQTVPHNDAA
jgi:hypothetical protein